MATRAAFVSQRGIIGTLLVLGLVSACNKEAPTGPAESLAGAAAATAPTITAADPSAATQDTTLDVRVLGSGFDLGSTAEFGLDGVVGPKVRTNRTTYRTSKELVANITIAVDAVPDRYDVIVTTSRGKKGIGTERFAVVRVTDLGTLGGASSVARAIDPEGRIVGRSALASGLFRAFVWTEASGMRELPSTDGNAVAIANGIIVGKSGTRAARWTLDAGAWVLTQLGGLGGANDMAWDINGSGVIVGSAALPSGELRAVQWMASTTPSPLPVQAGATGAQALGINSSGTIVGTHNESTSQIPIVWPLGGALKRLAVCPGAIHARAEAINDAGVIVGNCQFPKSNLQAVRWVPDPDPLKGWLSPQGLTGSTGLNRASGINNAGQIVGVAAGKAFLWEEGAGLRILEGIVLNGDGEGFGISESTPGVESRIVGWSGKPGASSGNHAVWWPAP